MIKAVISRNDSGKIDSLAFWHVAGPVVVDKLLTLDFRSGLGTVEVRGEVDISMHLDEGILEFLQEQLGAS